MEPLLFPNNSDPIQLDMKDADVWYYPAFFTDEESTHFYDQLTKTIAWQQDPITIFGKTYMQPRLTALYANNTKPYRYSNITMHPKAFTPELLSIKNSIENTCNTEFTTCLLNLYRNGSDSNGWHADNEKELGQHPVIASVTFGEERWFHFKHRHDKNLKLKVKLQHGSLLVMQGATQENWLHQIPKTKKKISPRINLTFRVIK